MAIDDIQGDSKPPQCNYYTCLGVRQDATSVEIRKAYLHIAVATHPDKNPRSNTQNTAAEEFIRIQEAYNVLIDPVQRNNYNQKTYGVKNLKTSATTKHECNQTGDQHMKEPMRAFTTRVVPERRTYTDMGATGLAVGPGLGGQAAKMETEKIDEINREKTKNRIGKEYKAPSLGNFGLVVGPGRH